jgi:hypothetical protein
MKHHQVRSFFLFALIVGTGLFGLPASAKDMSHRLGVGYSDNFAISIPSLAVRYYSTSEVGFSLHLGVNTESENSKFGFGGRFYKIIFPEDHMNFYMGAGAAILSSRVRTVNDSGFEMSAFGGAEFFIPGLDSLAMMFDAGVGIVSLSNGVNFRTIADSPLKAGMIFYF